MNHARFLLPVLCVGLLISGCQKDDDEPATPASTNNNGGGGGNGSFTPPTTTYWKINGVANTASMDAVSVNINGNHMSVSKPFSDLGFGYCHLRVFMDNSNFNLRDTVPEGGYIDFHITANNTYSTDSIHVELDVEDQNSATQGYYFYKANSGVLHVSKLNDKLRFTSEGIYSLTGELYLDDQDSTYTCTLDFSEVEP